MKSSSKSRSQRNLGFKVHPVAAGCAVLLMMGADMAVAQQAEQQVTVTGIRRGIESAISVKKNAEGVVEAISAEDIGKLPDSTIAESLARLPGLTTQRTKDGNASTITIRGLGPDFNGYLLNGREQSGTGDSRAADLSVYPAELIAGVTVYKTSDAGLMTAGLAGTIDNRLIDPLSFSSRKFAASAQKIETGRGLPVKGEGHRYSLSYIDQFADRKIGVALGYVRADGSANQIATGGWGGATVTATLASNGATQTGVKVPAPFGGGLDYANKHITDKRDGAAAILVFKPNKDLTSQIDYFQAKIDTLNKNAAIKGGLGGPITNAVVDANGNATKGTFQLAGGTNRLIDYTEAIVDNDKLQTIGWKTTLKINDTWTGSVDLSKNKAERVERDNEYYGVIAGADTLSFDTTGGSPKFTFGTPTNYTDKSIIKVQDVGGGWSGIGGVPQAGYSKGPTVKDKVDAFRVDLKHDLPEGGLFSDVQFGLNHAKRTKDRITDEALIVSAAANNADPISFPGNSYVERSVGGTGLDVLTFDPTATVIPGAALLRKYNDDILSKTWSVAEKVTTAYVKAGVDTKLGGIPVKGNAGVQIVSTDQSSLGYRAEVGSSVTLTNPAGKLTSAGTSYTDILPSVNLTGDLGGGNQLRVSLSQQIARANMTDLRNSFAASVDTDTSHNVPGGTFGKFIGSAGNPALKPFKAKSLDLSYEKYVGNRAYYSVAGFYKKLDTYITTATNTNFDYTAYATALGLTIPVGGPRGVFTAPVNGNGGSVSGIELTASAPFNLITPVLNGFGGMVSYSDTSSSVSLPNTLGQNPNQQVSASAGNIPLPGLSRQNAKLMLYFERAGFSAFVAQNYRSTFVGSVANDAVGGYPTLRYIQGSSWVSAQIGYEVQEGQLKGLGLRVEGNNLNKPVYRQLKADGKTVDSTQETGASISLKVSYKL